MSAANGGPAFPRPMVLERELDRDSRFADEGADGMSLRDYFAAQALNGLCSDPTTGVDPNGKQPPAYAAMAYLFADAMLAERERAR